MIKQKISLTTSSDESYIIGDGTLIIGDETNNIFVFIETIFDDINYTILNYNTQNSAINKVNSGVVVVRRQTDD